MRALVVAPDEPLLGQAGIAGADLAQFCQVQLPDGQLRSEKPCGRLRDPIALYLLDVRLTVGRANFAAERRLCKGAA